MNLNTELQEFTELKFRTWFDQVARDGINYEAALLEALDKMEESQRKGQTVHYELGGAFTRSGNPEIYYL